MRNVRKKTNQDSAPAAHGCRAKSSASDRYTYRITWSPEDGECLGLCAEFPCLSWLAKTPETALKGIRRVVADAVADLRNNGERVPSPIAGKQFSGEIRVRVSPQVHRMLAIQAAEGRISLNRLASTKLAA